MLQITLDMYQTLAVAVVVLMLGRFLRGRVRLLERFCIPAPVIGGVLFAVFTCVCYGTGIAEFAFDDILKEVCMVFFFTSVGFQANLKVLRSGGTAMIVFLVLVIGLIVGQNFVAIGLSNVVAYDYFSATVGAFFTRKTLMVLSTDEKLAWVKTIFEQNERCGCQRVKDALFIYCLRLLSHMGIVTADLSFTNLVMREINAITEDRKNAAIMPQALVTEL